MGVTRSSCRIEADSSPIELFRHNDNYSLGCEEKYFCLKHSVWVKSPNVSIDFSFSLLAKSKVSARVGFA